MTAAVTFWHTSLCSSSLNTHGYMPCLCYACHALPADVAIRTRCEGFEVEPLLILTDHDRESDETKLECQRCLQLCVFEINSVTRSRGSCEIIVCVSNIDIRRFGITGKLSAWQIVCYQRSSSTDCVPSSIYSQSVPIGRLTLQSHLHYWSACAGRPSSTIAEYVECDPDIPTQIP